VGEIEEGVIINMQFQKIFSFSFTSDAGFLLIATDKIRRKPPRNDGKKVRRQRRLS
jgi:hypothetical protein